LSAVRLYAGTQDGVTVCRSQNGGWEEVGRGLSGGIIDSVDGCRTRPERVFVGVTADGLYRTDDAGEHWTKVLDGDIRSVTVDPTDDRVVYAGTEPVHLYRSEDGGDSWEELTPLLALPEQVRKNWWFPRPPHLGHIRYIFIHPQEPRTVYLCIEHGGIVRSLDRGQTWEDVSGGIDYVDIHHIGNIPGRFDRYLVASARGFYGSDEPTRGWTRAQRGFNKDYFHDFLFLPPKAGQSNPTLLVATAEGSPGVWEREHRGARAAVYRSVDEAESWHPASHGLPEDLDAMVWALIPHPHDAGAAFVGLGAVARGHATGSGPSGEVWLTTDRGDSWQRQDVQVPAVRVMFAAGD
jgi:photosystem II stability/assembly factor-like uncharacterized protein